MKSGCRIYIPTDPMHIAFVYVIKGSIETEGRSDVNTGQVVLYQRGESLIDLFSKAGAEISFR